MTSGTPIKFKNEKDYIYPYPYFPVGFVYISVIDVDPNEMYVGTWKQIENDAYLKIVTSTAGQCGGTSKDHKIPISSIPSHAHQQRFMTDDFAREGGSGDWNIARASGGNPAYSYETGGGQPYYPYYYGIYVWIRIA